MKGKPNYGYPIGIILLHMLMLHLITLIMVLSVVLNFPLYLIIFISIAGLCYIVGLIILRRKFDVNRINLVKKMIDLLDVEGNEVVLDLGTGSGFLAIYFAKCLQNGVVYGLDRWSFIPITFPLFLAFTIMTGCTQNNAKRNAQLEGVADKCKFVIGSLTDELDFPDNYFDIICSSQSLYWVDDVDEQQQLFKEINRILKRDGKIIFFEPKKTYSNWDIENPKSFFKNIGYRVKLVGGWILMGWKSYN